MSEVHAGVPLGALHRRDGAVPLQRQEEGLASEGRVRFFIFGVVVITGNWPIF
jgi:hypothetical protein